jgi:hypothetical protein
MLTTMALVIIALTWPASAAMAAPPAASPAAASLDESAVVLVNSASPHYSDYATYIKPYLDQFGVPYTSVDVASGPALSDLAAHALIILGHRDVNPSASEQTTISAAVASGTGLVNFDNDLFTGSVSRYPFVDTVFGFVPGGATTGSGVTITGPAHYITTAHSAGETISTRPMTMSGAALPASGVSALVTAGGAPLVAVASFGSGRAVQWGSYDWASYNVLGPLRGLDDLVWRSLVWAARKPFAMRGLPPFVTMRMDDVSDPLTWIPAANAAGFIPWAGVFTNDIDSTEAAGLSALVHAGKATVAIHAFGTSDFFYFDHNNGTNFSDAQMAANYAAGSAWFAANNIPISTYLVPHYYEIGSNAFAGLAAWGVKTIGTMMDPGQLESSAPWMAAGPFRTTQAGQAYDRNANPYYADFMTIPGHPEMNGQFFNLITEIRDISGYEWLPSPDVAASVASGTTWLTRPLDGMELATLFSHEYAIPDAGVSPAAWSATMAGIAANLAPYHPIYVSMDQASQYLRALKTSTLTGAQYDPTSGTMHATFTGSSDTATKFYVFRDNAGADQFGHGRRPRVHRRHDRGIHAGHPRSPGVRADRRFEALGIAVRHHA